MGVPALTFVHSIIARILMRLLELARVVLLYRDVLDGLTAGDHRLCVDIDDIVRRTTLCAPPLRTPRPIHLICYGAARAFCRALLNSYCTFPAAARCCAS